MYLVSVYFDKTAEHILQRYINKIAEKTGNSFMTDNNVPPHMTISAIEARSENALLGAMDNLRNSLSNGTISIVSVGQLLPYVFYATPVLNGYLQDLSEKVFDEVWTGLASAIILPDFLSRIISLGKLQLMTA